jgi:hypothetical protein
LNRPMINAQYRDLKGHDVIVDYIATCTHSLKEKVVFRDGHNRMFVIDLENHFDGWNDPEITEKGITNRFTLVGLV